VNALARVTRASVSTKSALRRSGKARSAARSIANGLGDARVAPGDDVADEAAVGVEAVEVAVAAQHQRLIQRGLEVAVGGLDRAVLVRQPAVVA
jgi:hypothetical protein